MQKNYRGYYKIQNQAGKHKSTEYFIYMNAYGKDIFYLK